MIISDAMKTLCVLHFVEMITWSLKPNDPLARKAIFYCTDHNWQWVYCENFRCHLEDIMVFEQLYLGSKEKSKCNYNTICSKWKPFVKVFYFKVTSLTKKNKT